MSTAHYLADTSALVRIVNDEAVRTRWERQIAAGTIAFCPVVELEFLYTARSKAHRGEILEALRTAFSWIAMPERVFDRAAEVQAALTGVGAHRSAGAVDLLVAAAAEFHGLTLLHHDRDFDQVVRVTGQRARWLFPPVEAQAR
jgi:predicted nucleic acid-binding protein